MKFISSLFSPSVQSLMAQELEAAQRELLIASSTLEAATASVAYNKARIARLREALEPPTTDVSGY